jgi:hypothetical protein
MRIDRCLSAAVLAVALSSVQALPPAPVVALVFPSGPEVPANLLRLSLQFERPVEGPVLGRLALLDADGTLLPAPFFEQELWSPDGKTLTILMHPGRVKSGLIAHDELGPILSAGQDITLVLDGRPIKRWHVGQADTAGPDATAWALSTAPAGSRLPLTVTLDGPIDGRDAYYLAVADPHGGRMTGQARLVDGERVWTFVPSAPWSAGAYKLVIRGTLEDACGNRLGSRFETPVQSPPGTPVDAEIPFSVR